MNPSQKFQREEEKKFPAGRRLYPPAWAGVVWRAPAGGENYCERPSGGRREGMSQWQSKWRKLLYGNRLNQMTKHDRPPPPSHFTLKCLPISIFSDNLKFFPSHPDTSNQGLYVQFSVIYFRNKIMMRATSLSNLLENCCFNVIICKLDNNVFMIKASILCGNISYMELYGVSCLKSTWFIFEQNSKLLQIKSSISAS